MKSHLSQLARKASSAILAMKTVASAALLVLAVATAQVVSTLLPSCTGRARQQFRLRRRVFRWWHRAAGACALDICR